MRIRAAVVGLLILAATDRAFVQATASLTGTVVTTDSQSQPIPGAIVTLTGGGIRDNLSTVTDQAGRFAFPGLTPARYMVAVSKRAYLTMAYGAPKPGRAGASVAVTAGQTLDLQIALPRGAAISGTVRDHLGKPAVGISVLVTRAEPPSGASGPYLEFIATTDDRGAYRAFGLPPDTYIVLVLPIQTSSTETSAPTRDEVDAKLRRLEQRFGTGAAAAASPAAPDPTIVFGAVFYPGTPNAAEAAHIRVAAGDERRGIDMQLVPARTVKVSGVIQGEGFQPGMFRPQLVPYGPSQAIWTMASPFTLAANGAFTFVNVTAGRYTLVVNGGVRGPAMFAVTDVTVGDTDVSGLILTLRSGPPLSGRVVFDGVAAKAPQNHQLVRIGLVPVRSSGARSPALELGAGVSTTPVNVQSDGTFTFAGVYPGTYSINAFLSAVSGWWLKSAVVNGRDVLDAPFEVEETTPGIADVVVTFTDKRAELAGTLTTASGRPSNEFVVVVYSANREFWRPGARRIRSVRPASDGAFSVMDLPAGEYMVAAVTDADPDEWQQPSFLEQLVSASIKVTIAEGQKTRQDLRIGR